MTETNHRGGLWVLGQNLLTLAALVMGPVFRGPGSDRAAVLAASVLLAAGAVMGLAGVRALGRNRTPYPRPLPDSHLVQSGIYSVTRHPLYSSLILLTLGWSILWSSAAALAASLGLAVLLDGKARVEERWLRVKFPEYEAYARRVRRLLPWFY